MINYKCTYRLEGVLCYSAVNAKYLQQFCYMSLLEH